MAVAETPVAPLRERHGLPDPGEPVPGLAWPTLGVYFGALAVWGTRHVHPETALVHTDCGEPVQVGYYCPHCDTRVERPAVTLQS